MQFTMHVRSRPLTAAACLQTHLATCAKSSNFTFSSTLANRWPGMTKHCNIFFFFIYLFWHIALFCGSAVVHVTLLRNSAYNT